MLPDIKTEQVGNKYGVEEHFRLLGTSAATAANYSVLMNVLNPIELVLIEVSFTTASTSGTLQFEKLTVTTAPGAGSVILDSVISLSGTANTLVTSNQRQMTSARVFERGDRIALVDAGTLTNLTDLVVSIYYKPRGRGEYR